MSKEKLIAKAIRQALNEELKFAAEPRKGDVTKMTKSLWPKPPTRGALSFQTKKNDNKALSTTLKQEMVPQIADHEHDPEEAFCMAHGGFHLLSVMDIEHAVPYAEIRKHQATLLAYLNEHQKVADELLKYEDMQKLFGRAKSPSTSSRSSKKRSAKANPNLSPKPTKKKTTLERDNSANAKGEILGSSYFYKLCYNSMDNIWLLCHACNNNKSADDPLGWLASTRYFGGQHFKKSMEELGPTRQGILIGLIGGTLQNDRFGGEQIPFNIIHGGKGFGKHLREWFLNHRQEALITFRKEHNEHYAKLIEQVDTFLELLDSEEPEDKSKAAFMFENLYNNLDQQKSLGRGYMQAAHKDYSLKSPASKLKAPPSPRTPNTVFGIDQLMGDIGGSLYKTTVGVHDNVRDLLIKPPFKELNIWPELSQKIYKQTLSESQITKIKEYLETIANDNSITLDREEILGEVEELMRPEEEILKERLKIASAKLEALKEKLESLTSTSKTSEKNKTVSSGDLSDETSSSQQIQSQFKKMRQKLQKPKPKENPAAPPPTHKRKSEKK